MQNQTFYYIKILEFLPLSDINRMGKSNLFSKVMKQTEIIRSVLKRISKIQLQTIIERNYQRDLADGNSDDFLKMKLNEKTRSKEKEKFLNLVLQAICFRCERTLNAPNLSRLCRSCFVQLYGNPISMDTGYICFVIKNVSLQKK